MMLIGFGFGFVIGCVFLLAVAYHLPPRPDDLIHEFMEWKRKQGGSNG